MNPGERRRLLGLLGFLSFNAVYVGVVMAPVLTQIAGEFNITTGTAGLVVAAYGAPGIVVTVLTGPYSDRFGRKRFLVTGSLIMGLFTLLSAFATSFAVLVAMRIVAGIGGSVIFPNTTATVGDNFSYRDRGSAMGTVIGYGSLGYVCMLLLKRRSGKVLMGAVLTLLILVVGGSRIYLRAHWLSDVVGGFAVGVSWMALCIAVARWRSRPVGATLGHEVPAE